MVQMTTDIAFFTFVLSLFEGRGLLSNKLKSGFD